MGLFAFCLFAASTAIAKPLAVEEIIERHIAARGGRERISALQSLVIRGEYREGDHISPNAIMALMRPFYKLVGDPDKSNPDFAEGYDGSAWEFYRDPGIVLRTVGAASAAARHRARFDHPLIDHDTFGTKVQLLGEERVGDRPAYRLLMTLEDGFREEALIDKESFLLIAERKAAPVHAFGAKVTSETRYSDFRPVEGVLFAFQSEEVETATGKMLSEFRTTSITANRRFDTTAFSPPQFRHTPLQTWLEQLYVERDDALAVMWTYHDFRRAYAEIDTHDGAQAIGYQMLKMDALPAAIALLETNAADYPRVASAHFGLGRAYRTAGETAKAKSEFERALAIDPGYKRAADALKSPP